MEENQLFSCFRRSDTLSPKNTRWFHVSQALCDERGIGKPNLLFGWLKWRRRINRSRVFGDLTLYLPKTRDGTTCLKHCAMNELGPIPFSSVLSVCVSNTIYKILPFGVIDSDKAPCQWCQNAINVNRTVDKINDSRVFRALTICFPKTQDTIGV